MRPRKWVLVVAICFFSLALLLFQGKRSLERNRNLENLLIEAVASTIKGTCTVEAVRIGFFSVYLRNVSVSLPLQAFSVSIRNIKVGLSFIRLIAGRGNLIRSINRIILIGPTADFSLPQPQRAAAAPPHSPPPLPTPGPLPEAPVQSLLIKGGAIRLHDRGDAAVVLAEGLTGKLSNNVDEMSLSLNGASGSSKRNVSLHANHSWTNNKNHVSVRLNDARFGRRISLDNMTVSTGSINGAVECTFTDPFSPDSMELHGWVRLSGAAAAIEDPPLLWDSITVRLSLENGGGHISALDAAVRGMRCTALGDFRFTGGLSARLSVACPRLTPDSLYGFLPDSLLKRLSGTGRAEGSITLNKGESPFFSVAVGGIGLENIPLEKIRVSGHLSETKLFADSALVKTPFLTARLHGSLELDSAKNRYDIGFSITSDSLPGRSGLEGDILVIGNATASPGRQPDISCRIWTKELRFQHIALGSPQLVASLENNRLSFRSVEVDSATSVVVSGVVDSIISPSPVAVFSASVGPHPIKEQLKRMHGMPKIDSAHLAVTGSGWINRFSAAVELALRVKEFDGVVRAKIDRLASDTGALVWNMSAENVRYRNVPLAFSGSGKVLDSMVVIDTMSGYGGVHGSARIFHAATSPRIDALFTYRKPVADLLRFFPGKATGLDSGSVAGTTVVSGTFDSLITRSSIRLRNLGNEELGGFSADLTIHTRGNRFKVLPTTIKRETYTVLTLDTITNPLGRINFKGTFANLTPRTLLGPLIPVDMGIEAFINGSVGTSSKGLPVEFACAAPYIALDTVRLDSIRCRGTIDQKGIMVARLDFRDGKRSIGRAEGFLPWAMLGRNSTDLDTLRASVHLAGDLLATMEKNVPSPIGGTAKGTADIAFHTAAGNWRFTRGAISMPQGILRVRPFVLDDIKNFTFRMTIDSNALVHTATSGTIRRRPISIISEHRIPDGYEPLTIGPLNFGMFQTVTPKKGVDLHLPGFMPLRERGNIEFRGKKPFDHFTISGPLEKLKITGVWVLRDIEFTFPFLPAQELQWEHDPFPYVTWEMDLITGNRNAMYFWELTGKRNRIMRFLEAYLDPSSIVNVRGRYLDNTFRLYGTIRSYKGAVYYGRVFDRNVDIGVEFDPQKPDKNRGYDNLPLVWGSAEAFSDTSRQDRIKLTCIVNDPATGGISEKGRLVEGPKPNITFHLSSDFDEQPGESEREYFRRAGITFTSLEGAGSAVSDFGEQMFHRYLLQRWERRIARKLGLDVMNIETSIVSNYFNKLYGRQFDGLLNEDDYLALANVGVTV
ncbi:MAG: hypothetical protein JW913_16550, partial [Chitinispirillaceae bacterium]|nr:hypothetical protein [Chitinispirillaceae bacterium]